MIAEEESDNNQVEAKVRPTPLDNMLIDETSVSTKAKKQVILDEDGHPFSLMYSKLDNSFCSNFAAIFIKRFHNYRRNRKVMFNEVILPALAMVTGVLIANINYHYQSPPETISPEMYPPNQKFLFNSEAVDATNSNIPPSQIIEQFPMYESMFTAYETNAAKGSPEMYEFSNQVYRFGLQNCGVEPF